MRGFRRDASDRGSPPATDGDRRASVGSARAEALARLRPTRHLHPVTLVVLGVGLVVTTGLVVAAVVAHDRNEDRLLEQRSHAAATVATSSIVGLQGQLAAASIAADADREGFGAAPRFDTLVGSEVGPARRFVSASVWPLDGDAEPSVVLGARPLLADEPPAVRRAFLADTAAASTLSLRDYLAREDRRLGYAYTAPGTTTVVYVEAALPRDRRARIAADSAFADLDYELYLDAARPSQLLASSSGAAPDGRRVTTEVPFGDSSLVLVVSPRTELGGDLLAVLPWALAGVGLLLTFAAGFFAERLVRRRARAEELSNRLEEVAEENATLYRWQRQVAEQLQRSLMPRSLPRLDHLEAAGRYEAGVAGTEVGGDWYDVVPLSDSRLAFSVGDVCGRGLAAAALMASLRYSIRAYALEDLEPATILTKLSAVVETTSDATFATVICGMLDSASGMLTVARAGHLDLLAVDGRGARYLDAPLGPPVGVDREWTYESATVQLDEDVVLLAFTDGLVERRTESLEVGLERLRRAAETPLPLAPLVAHIVDTVAGTNGDDDVAVLGLRWTRALDTTIATVDLPPSDESPATARRFVRAALDGTPLDRDVLELLTAELVTNVVRHVGSPMQLRVVRRPTSIRVELDDASAEVPRRQAPDPTMERGRGMLIVEAFATAWGVEPRDGGKTVWFELALDGIPV